MWLPMLVLTMFFAFFLSAMVEVPISNIESLIFTPRKKPTAPSQPEPTSPAISLPTSPRRLSSKDNPAILEEVQFRQWEHGIGVTGL